MSRLPRFFAAKGEKCLNFGGVVPHLGCGVRGLCRGSKATALEGVLERDDLFHPTFFGLSDAGFELDLNRDVAVGARTIGNCLLDGQSNSAGGARE
jgi:hypothetical protein